MKRFTQFCAATLLGAAAVLGAAQAHHSFAAFDKTKTASITGTVKEFEFTNPHVWLWVNVPGSADTKAGLYAFESGGPSQLDRMGLGRDTFPAGSKLTVSFHPLRDGRLGGQLLTATFPNGTVLDMMKQVKIFSSGEVQ